MHYVYVIQSIVDNTYYVGYSHDLRSRLDQHNQGKSSYTNGKRPWRLIYYEAYLTEKSAKARELKLKQHGKAYTALIRRLKEN